MPDLGDQRFQLRIVGEKRRVHYLHAHFDGVHIVDAVDDDLVRLAQLVHAHQHAFDLRREHVDAADDEHVVRPADHAGHARRGAAALAGLVGDGGDVFGAVAQDGHPLFDEGGDDHFALLPFAQHLVVRDIDHFAVVHVFIDVHARLFAAFARNAGAAHFGEAVVLRGEGAEDLIERLVHFRRGGLRAHAYEAQLQIVQHPLLPRRLRQVHGVAGRGDERRGAEVLEQHDLPVGIARRHGHHRRPQLFHPVMQAETAREQAVTEGDVEDILVRRPRHGEDAGDAGRPVVEVCPRIAADDGLARRARRGMQADDLFHRHGKQAEGIVVAQVVFGGIRDQLDVFERLDMLRLQADLVKAAAVHGHVFVRIAHGVLEPLQLQFA